YERLEFLGDAYLDAIAGTELYRRMKNVGEGRLTRTRATVVCEHSLAKVGSRIGIGAYFNMGNGEDHCGGRHRESIVADGVEAVIGAIFLDGGYNAASDFVLREFSDIIEDAIKGRLFTDFKTQVQEILQKDGTAPDICYVLDREEGPDHDKTFYVHLTCDGRTLGSGMGKSKKEAEQNAAKATLNGGLI
ncbi:MAG: ribonuclease III, partial [Clostridiales bacterium]|nr:ribonuclease III [Clostridiales bacterium]